MDQLRIIALCWLFSFSFNGDGSSQVEPFDLLITELMVDPTPVVGLPNFEWVEIYNRSDRVIDLKDFQFSSDSSPKYLPTYNLEPGAYVLITDDSNEAALINYGPTICVASFPSLTNSADAATILDPNGNIIHDIQYSRSWYNDGSKDDGGYTLELKNPLDPCLGSTNWAASENEIGGTPGSINSIWNPRAPESGLRIESVQTISESSIQISFDRIPSDDLNEMDFEITDGVEVIDLQFSADDPLSFELELNKPLDEGVPYEISLLTSAKDCEQLNATQISRATVILPIPLSEGDIIISEILFDPFPYESDYVELVNVTDNHLDLSSLLIGNLYADGSGTVKEFPNSTLLSPGDFLVVTENKSLLQQRFPQANPSRIVEIDLPSFNNTSGNVSLVERVSGEDVIIDDMNYTEEMHNAFIDDAEGVALERVNINGPADSDDNWQSAAASTGYGTPTLPNSQQENSLGSLKGIRLKSKTFFPQGHPTNEQLEIIFDLDRSNYVATIDVYDSSGRSIRNLANNQLLGRSDRYIWDGMDTDGILSNAGVYIILIRMLDSTGILKTKKLPCVLSRPL